MRLPLKVLLALTCFGWSGLAAHSQQLTPPNQSVTNSDLVAVQKTTEQFIEAFINLDFERLSSFFAAEATVFFPPSAKSPRRANGKAEIEAVFRVVFDGVRKQKPNPPYLRIEPREMKVQMLGDVAVVTFHLEDPDLFSRRTIVFQKRGTEWLIVHLHASGVARAKIT